MAGLPHESPKGCASICGYLHRVEVRSIGLITRRRYWFALSDSSPYLYYYKDRDDVKCSGRLSLTGAAFTYDPKEKNRFEIHVANEKHVFECSSDKLRDEWMRCLQDTRKKRWLNPTSHIDSTLDVSTLSTVASSQDFLANVGSPTTVSPVPPPRNQKTTSSNLVFDRNIVQSGNHENVIVVTGDLVDFDGSQQKGRGDSTSDVGSEGTCSNEERRHSTSEWYLDADGQLNGRSLQMPEEVASPEAVIKKLAERTNEGIEAPFRAIRRMTSVWRRQPSADDSKKTPPPAPRQTTPTSTPKAEVSFEDRCIELTDRVSSLEAVVESLRNALITSQRQNETLAHLQTIENDEELKEYLLEKERYLTQLQLASSQQARRICMLEDENNKMQDTINDLEQSVEAFRESVRTKEELILRMCEEREEPPTAVAGNAGDEEKLITDIEVPEGILIDVDSIDCEEEARKVFDEENVKDLEELKDLVEGYRAQNHFLNTEIVELHAIVQSLEEREKKLIRQNFDLEACYYQLKSRYLMVLNHFKSPEKPGKIMQPGVLRELLTEAGRTPRDSQQSLTDQLGFFTKDKNTKEKSEEDLLDTASQYMRKADDIIEATKLEQSEGYMKWLQSWDAFLVNTSLSRQAIAASNDLKALIRTGVPQAYRGRVWKKLLCRDLHTANSPLWSKELLEICLSGAQSRSRLGAKEYVTNDFSKQLDEILSSEGYLRSGQRLISFDLFASAFNKTALTLTTKLDQKLIRELHANDQLAKLWNDLEQVSSGSVANQYAAMIFTPDSTANDFYDAFWLAVREGVSEENVSRFTWSHAKNEFGCKIEKPLSYFIGDEHIRAMNLCAHFIHVSYRTLEVLMTISTDNALIERLTASHSNTPSECSSTGLETDHMMNSFGLRKRLKYLVFVLKQLVSHFREFFIYKVERAGFRKRVHEAMELYTAMADELRLRSVSKALSQKYLDECEDKLNKSIRMILLLSKQYGHDQDTIFHALAAKIGYRPNSD